MSAAQCSHGLVLLLVGMQLASAAFVPGAEVSVLYATDAACTEYDITTFPDGTYAVFFILEDSYFTMQGYEKNGTLSWKKLSPYAGTGSVPVLLDSIHYTPLISSGASAVLGAAVIMVPAREPMTYILATLPVTTRQQWPSGAYTTHYSSASVSSTTELYASVSVCLFRSLPHNATTQSYVLNLLH
ncbi:hypothetical protein DIPPA_51135 [Diplonema papillatum]|nr:hypothetical protein DIPPA_51135 [Diplonema papillatum]